MLCTMVQNRKKKHRLNSHPIIHCPTGLFVSEVSGADKRTNGQASDPVLTYGFLIFWPTLLQKFFRKTLVNWRLYKMSWIYRTSVQQTDNMNAQTILLCSQHSLALSVSDNYNNQLTMRLLRRYSLSVWITSLSLKNPSKWRLVSR